MLNISKSQICTFDLLLHDLTLVSAGFLVYGPSDASPLEILFPSKLYIYSVYSKAQQCISECMYFMFEELQYGGSNTNNHKFIIRTSQISQWYLTLIFNFNTGRELRWWWSWQLETFNTLAKVLATTLWKKHVLKDMLERVGMVLKVQSR